MRKLVAKFLADQSGATAIEYALIAAGISIVIVVYESGPTLAECLAAVRAQTFTDYEILLVDNASSDRVAQAAAKADPAIRLIENANNLGFAAAVNQGALPRTYANLIITMLIGGLWHGASWNFVIWGGLHGGMLAFERSQGRKGVYHNLPKLVRIALTFLIVTIGWVFFRGGTLRGAVHYLGAMFHLHQPFPNAALIDRVEAERRKVLPAEALWRDRHLMGLAREKRRADREGG